MNGSPQVLSRGFTLSLLGCLACAPSAVLAQDFSLRVAQANKTYVDDIMSGGLFGDIKGDFSFGLTTSATYDTNTGAGSSWEPRVADPRGRSYTLRVDYKFF